jgi:hypothetical protein
MESATLFVRNGDAGCGALFPTPQLCNITYNSEKCDTGNSDYSYQGRRDQPQIMSQVSQ